MSNQQANKTTDQSRENEEYIPATTEYVDEYATEQPQAKSEASNPNQINSKPCNVVVNIPKEDDRKSITANNIAFWGLIINLVLAFFTFLLFKQNTAAIAASQAAVTQAAEANALTRENMERDKRNGIVDDEKQKLKDSMDSLKYAQSRIDIEKSLAISKINAEAAIKSTEVSERNFAVYKEFANASKKSADVSEKSADFYRESAMMANRAYIALDTAFCHQCKITDSIGYVNFRLVNAGQTPAYRVRTLCWAFFINEKNVDTAWLTNYGYPQTTGVTVAAGKPFTIYVPLNITKKNREDLTQKKVQLFVAFKVEYIDVFGIKHETKMMGKTLGRLEDMIYTDFFNGTY